MKIYSLILCFLALGLASCSSDSETNVLASGYSNAVTSINVMSKMSTSGTSSLSVQAVPGTLAAPAIGADWTNAALFINDATTPSSNMSFKDWMGQQLDASAIRENGSNISMFGRMNSGIEIFCILGNSGLNIDESTGYPVDGDQSLTLTAVLIASLATDCPKMDISSEMTDAVIGINTSNPADTSLFDKKIIISLPGPSIQDYFLRFTDSAVNIATTENNGNGMHRTMVFLDLTNNITRVEYVSGPAGAMANDQHLAVHRLYYDGNADLGHMASMEFTQTAGPNEDTRYTVGGKPEATGVQFSLTMTSTSLPDTGVRKACVDGDGATAGDISTDGVICGDTAVSIPGIDVSTVTALTTIRDNYDGGNFDVVNPASGLDFTPATFATAAFTGN